MGHNKKGRGKKLDVLEVDRHDPVASNTKSQSNHHVTDKCIKQKQ